MSEINCVFNLEFGSLVLICYLACLHEAAPAEAGTRDFVLSLDALCSIRLSSAPPTKVGFDDLRVFLNFSRRPFCNSFSEV